MSDNTVRLIIELENRVKAQLRQIQQQIYDIQKATNFARVNFNNSVARSNMTLGKLQQTLKSVGVWGQTSFNQLSAAQRRTLLEMAQMDPKARNIMQRLNEIGIAGKSTFQQLTQSEKNALTEMYSLAQSVTYATTNFSQFGINVKAAQIALQQLDNNSNFQSLNTSLQSAKVKVSSLGVDINSTKGKIMSLGIAAKEAIGGGFSQGISLGKTKLSELSASVSSAKAKLAGFYNSTKTAGGGLGFLRTAASMTVGMIGFDLVNSMVQGARESINAAASFERFGQRLGMTEGELQQFHGAVDKMQDSFRKVDMNAVGAAALEMGVKLKLPKDSMDELTKTTAVMSSAFVKEGRTQEDAILAVSDAMDGQFRRLQELGISQDMLMKNGWDGDINNKTGLLQAMNKTLDDMGFTQTAQEIVTLDDAWAALTVTGSKLIQSALVPITPIIIAVVEMITWMVGALQSAWSSMPDWAQTAATVAIFAGAILLVMGYISSLGGVLAILGSALAPLIPIILGISAPMIAIVAIIAAIAFAVYEVGIAFGWWKDVGTMLEAIKNNIGRLWDAFINHPDVKATIKAIQDAWSDLNESLKPVVDWLKGIWDEIFPESAKGKVDGTRAIIDAIGAVFKSFIFRVKLAIDILTIIWDVFNGIQSLLRGDFTGALSFFTDAWNVLLEGLSPIAEFLESTLGPAFESFFATLQGDGGNPVELINQGFLTLMETLGPVGEFLLSVFGPAWQLVINVLQIIWNTIGQVIGIFQSFLTGQISLSQALSLIWQTILQMYAQILSTIISTVVSWANQLWNNAVKAGSNFVNGIINWLKQLPDRAQTYLLALAVRIITAGAQWISNGKTSASKVVSGVMSWIKQLPQKVYQEFLNIGSRILSAGSQLVENAKQIGKKIVDGMLSAMGIHSPGIIQEKVVLEFFNMLQRVKDKGKSAYEAGKNVGKNIVNGFNTADVENALNNISTTITTPVTTNTEVETDSANVDLSNNNSGTEETGDQYNGLVEEVSLASESITASNNMIGTSFSTLTAGIALNAGAIQMRVAGVVTSFQTTRNGVTTALTSMSNSNTRAWNNIKSTTTQNLNQVRNSTIDVTNKMTNAWGVMKDNIVSAAGSIQTQSYNKFSSLHRSIASFYNQLANAHFSSGLPAGPATNSTRGLIGGRTLPGGSINFGKSTKGTIASYAAGGLGQGKGRVIDTNSKVKHPQNNKSKSWLNLLDYNLPTSVINDLARVNGCVNPNTCFAGIPDTNVNKIMNTAYKWRIADPWFLGIQIPSDYHVEDFRDGKQPQLNPGNFENLLRKILTARGFQNPGTYEFYYNSRYSNQQVWDQVRCNCFDGAEMIIEIASMLGLSGHMIHGSWNGIGHVAAMVNGQIYDMTQFQKRGGIFRGGSGVSFGSASPGGSSKDVFGIITDGIYNIIDLMKTNQNAYFQNIEHNRNNTTADNLVSYTSDDVHLTIDHNLNVTVEGEDIDEKSIITTLKEVITDSKLIDRIAEALIKRDNRIKRMRG
ncbi:MAG: phage tail protein [Methanobrevibacter smithii]